MRSSPSQQDQLNCVDCAGKKELRCDDDRTTLRSFFPFTLIEKKERRETEKATTADLLLPCLAFSLGNQPKHKPNINYDYDYDYEKNLEDYLQLQLQLH